MEQQRNCGYNVNVWLEIIKRYSVNKEHKELLAVAVMFHLWRSNGVVWNVTYRNLMSWLHIGKPKAKRIIRQMQEDKFLFSCNGSKISARSFRDKTRKKTRKGRNWSGAICACFKANREYTLKSLYNIINDILTLSCIKATVGKTISSINDPVHPRAFLTCRSLAKVIGMGRSSVVRITNRLKEESTIIKDPGRNFLVLNMEHAKEIECALHYLGYRTISFQKGSYAYIVVPCGYAINDPEAYRSIRHKIYGWKSKQGISQQPTNELAKKYPTIPQFCE